MVLVGIAVFLVISIPKIYGEYSYSSQTTETQTKPLYWAINASSDDKCWISRTERLKLALGYFIRQYGGNYYELYRVIQCESSWKENAKNPDSTASGLAQYLDGTWDTYCKGDKDNSFLQLECLTKMWSKGMSSHWNASRECWKLFN